MEIYQQILLSAILPFIIERVWDCYNNKRLAKIKLNDLVADTINEINLNCTNGIGSSDAPFKLTAHESLLKDKSINEDLKEQLNQFLTAATLCNSYGGLKKLELNNGQVKGLEQKLKIKLESLLK